MSRTPTETLLAFEDELLKEAMPGAAAAAKSFLQSRGAGIGAGTGLGALAGGVGGFGIGGVRRYQEAREQGASRGQALGRGLAGGLEGATKGVTYGALAGAGAGALSSRSTALAKDLVNNEGILGKASRFGQRQLHSVTGWKPEGGLESIRGGTYNAGKRLEAAQQAMQNTAAGKGLRPAAEELINAQRHFGAVEKAVGHDLTNIPGMYNAMKGPNRWDAVKAGVGAGWHGDTAAGKAMNVALPVGLGAMALTSGPKDERGQTAGREIMGTAAGLMAPFSVMPMVGGQVLARGAMGVGKTVGRGVDRLRGRRHVGLPDSSPVPGTEGGDGGNAPMHVERSYSNSALGRPPEGLGS
jgi:hypothetical protein